MYIACGVEKYEMHEKYEMAAPEAGKPYRMWGGRSAM